MLFVTTATPYPSIVILPPHLPGTIWFPLPSSIFSRMSQSDNALSRLSTEYVSDLSLRCTSKPLRRPPSPRATTTSSGGVLRVPVGNEISSPYRIFFLNNTATTEIYTLSLHDALPI